MTLVLYIVQLAGFYAQPHGLCADIVVYIVGTSVLKSPVSYCGLQVCLSSSKLNI